MGFLMICLVGKETFQVLEKAKRYLYRASFIFDYLDKSVINSGWGNYVSVRVSYLLQALPSASDLLPLLKIASLSICIFLVLRG